MKQLGNHEDKEAIIAARAFECGAEAVRKGLIEQGGYNGKSFAFEGYKKEFLEVAREVINMRFEFLAEDAPLRRVALNAWVQGFYDGVEFGFVEDNYDEELF